ncbi:MAG TPA: hypothetical protein VL133_02545 [Devosia sp.]|nr:hypothetical protein [Devosia sp.]
MNHALAKARAPVVHIVPPGYLVDDGWASAALLQFEDQQVAAVAPVVLRPQQKERVVSAGLDYQPGGARQPAQSGSGYDVARLVRTRPLGAPLAGGFFRKSILDLLGGFDAQCGDSLADVDLALSLQQLGLRTECEPTSVLWEANIMKESRGRFSDGLQAERLYRKHLTNFDPQVAQQGHRRQIINELLWSLCQPWWLAQVAGRALGMLGSKADTSHAAKIADAKERLTLEQELPQVIRMPTRSAPATNQKLRRAA